MTLIVLALCILMASLGTSIANVALPVLALSFGASFQAVQWVVLTYLLAITVLIVSAGRLGDLIGRRRVLLAGIALFTAASALCGIAPTLWLLIAARGAQGLGAAVLMAIAMAMVRESVGKTRTGSAMGLLGTMSAVGTALGPSLGGALIAVAGWQAIFLALVPLGIFTFALAIPSLPHSGPSARVKGTDLDLAGTFLLALSLAVYALAMTAGGGELDRLNIVLLSLAILFAVLFLRVEARVPAPLINPSLFKNAALNASLIMNLCVSTVMMATLVIGPFFLTRVLELNEAVVGAIMAVGPVVASLSGVPAGWIVDRLGAPAIVITGLAQMAIGAFSLAFLPAIFGVAGYIAALVILTPGYQLFLAANNTAVMIDVTAANRGVVSGILNLSRNLGLISGASVMGAVFAYTAGTSDFSSTTPEIVGYAMRNTFMTAGGLIVFALIMAIASRVAKRAQGLRKTMRRGCVDGMPARRLQAKAPRRRRKFGSSPDP